jgi:predicted  nucleic acid-binding Zn-ribbon protein
MNTARDLYEIQLLDLEIERRNTLRQEAEGKLGETLELVEAREAREQALADLKALEDEQRTLEYEVQDLQEKANKVSEELYSGRVRNPKELQAINEELTLLQGHIREREEKQLGLYESIEAGGRAMKEREQELTEVTRAWEADQAQLKAEAERLREEAVYLERNRSGGVAHLPADSLALYERLRQQKQGRGVAKLERGMCQGCRISLPMNVLREARNSSRLVQCPSCQRILYMS